MTTRTRRHRSAAVAPLLIAAAATLAACTTAAQWSTTYEQHYLADGINWAFRNNYPAADRLFNAFDYGHAILYERLHTRPYDDPSTLEQKEYDFITKKLLVKPPRLPLEEAAIEVEYAKLVPEAKQMFDWAHLLHRQIYDVLADERVATPGEGRARSRASSRTTRRRPDLAFSSVPKTGDLMEEAVLGLAFRRSYPKFNGLIWAYHWLQVGLYEPLVTGDDADARQRRRARDDASLLADARERAAEHAANHADDGGRRAHVRDALPRGRRSSSTTCTGCTTSSPTSWPARRCRAGRSAR